MGAALASSAASPSAWPSCVMSKRNASSNFGSTEPAAVAIQHAMAAAMQHARIQTDAWHSMQQNRIVDFGSAKPTVVYIAQAATGPPEVTRRARVCV
jgi:hypothetical protein